VVAVLSALPVVRNGQKPRDCRCSAGENNMTKDNKKDHNNEIIDQFTKQAIPFTELPGH